MKKQRQTIRLSRAARRLGVAIALAALCPPVQASSISQVPLFLTQAVEPIVMLSLSNDHQLYFEAYNEYTDLTGDGVPNTTYAHTVDYYGYFDSYKCYDYENDRFVPKSETANKYCDGVNGDWSGNFLNWVTMARIDVVRRMLYGGYRSTDTASQTVLERTYLPTDAHSWARFYNGTDIARLTPFSDVSNDPVVRPNTTSANSIDIADYAGSADLSDTEWFTVGGQSDFLVYEGDQIWLESQFSSGRLQGYVTERTSTQMRVAIGFAEGSGVGNQWTVTNLTRRGITFCNTTRPASTSVQSQNVTDPPLMRVARGDYTLWGGNERWQCKWNEERRHTFGELPRPNSNGNLAAITELGAGTDNPVREQVGLGQRNYNVRVEVCVAGLLEDNCTEYGNNHKPEGLLQEFGLNEQIRFGMTSGSYGRNKSGGVLRKRAGFLDDEVDPDTGRFISGSTGIIGTLNRLRIYGYNHSDGLYNNADNCPWATRSFTEGNCSNWGNPQSELFLETLRYLAGAGSANFSSNDGGYVSGLSEATWDDPIESNKWCAPLSVIQFNASTSSFDAESLGGASDLGINNVNHWTNTVGQGEGIHGNQYFFGLLAGSDPTAPGAGVCTPKTVSDLSSVRGICPDEPRLGGSYHIAGLAHYARTNSIRNDLPGAQTVRTYGVELAPAVPDISVVDSSGVPVASILPACREQQPTPIGSCGFVDFKVVNQGTTASGSSGRFIVVWENSEWGGDYDQDVAGVISYELHNDTLTVSTRVFADTAPRPMGFGYVVSGTNRDGFHVHSGTNNFTAEGRCADADISCNLLAPATSETFAIGGSTASNLQRPLYYASKWGGFDTRLAQSPIDDPQSWDRNGDGIPDTYFFATDPRELDESLRSAFSSVAEAVSSVASIATNSTRLSTDTLIYQARFSSEDWSGELLAFEIDEGDGQVAPEPLWNAADFMQSPNDRRIFTWNDDTEQGVLFRWMANLSAAQQTAVGSQAKLDWLRGDRSDPSLRDMGSPLSDIVNSDPAFSGAQNFGFSRLDGTEGEQYVGFLQDKADRTPVLFVGSNGGMLHAFHAENGSELFAFVPQGAYAHIGELPEPGYQHRYFVDGSPRLMDVYLPDRGGWRTVLIGSMGAGGRSIFALDVSDPENFSGSDILWEITGTENDDLADHLGTSVPKPTIARMADGNFWAIFANGYESDSGTAGLFLLNMSNPSEILFLDTREGPTPQLGKNGLSSPIPVDTTGDRIADRIYAGDLHGNLWRFDVDRSQTQHWGFSNDFSQGQNRFPLFQARDIDNTGNVQPITARPEAGRHPDGGVMVYFGTGSFFRVGDNDVAGDDTRHAFYGIRDQDEPVNSDQSGLLIQEIEFEGPAFGTEVRVVSREEDETKEDGWRLELVSPVNGFEGERVIDSAQLRFGRIIFTTLIPSNQPCDFGGSSWLMEIDAITGGNFGRTIFDLNDDGLFDEDDYVDIGDEMAPVSGLRTQVGIVARPAIISAGEEEYKYMSGSSGEIERVREISGTDQLGRQTWRQVR